MNEITTLFTTIGEFFTKSAWYSMVKLPFWTLLFTVAAGGVYCARFGKKTLLNQGISSTLCIVTVYLGAMLLGLYIRQGRKVGWKDGLFWCVSLALGGVYLLARGRVSESVIHLPLCHLFILI